jgi:hypothetical protein
MRPTSDFSWPAPGHWCEWLVPSVNSSIDLENDFPFVRWMAFKDFADQALQLKALGEPVKMMVWDAASYYRHYEWSRTAVASHCRSWVGEEGAETLVDFRLMFG